MKKCPKCEGKGTISTYLHRDGGMCYNCNGKGLVQENKRTVFDVYIYFEETNKVDRWYGETAKTKEEAFEKAKKGCKKGPYAKYIDTIEIR